VFSESEKFRGGYSEEFHTARFIKSKQKESAPSEETEGRQLYQAALNSEDARSFILTA
jgi:hypothetical protein